MMGPSYVVHVENRIRKMNIKILYGNLSRCQHLLKRCEHMKFGI